MQRFQDMPINRKLTLVILLTCTAVLLVVGTAMIATEVITARRAMLDEMTVLADLLAHNSTAALSFHREDDVEDVDRALSALQAEPHIVSARVYDRNNAPFGNYARTGGSNPLPNHPPREGFHFAFDSLELTRPIEMQQRRIGVITLRADLGRLYRQLLLYAGIVGSVLLATSVIVFVVSRRLRRPIAEPILALAEVARRVAQDRDYSVRAIPRSRDEIGLLTDAFNQMLGETELAQKSLQNANHDLVLAKNAAEGANRAKDRFLAVLSHELRTPLTPVLLTISALQDRAQLPADIQSDVQIIRRHVELEARLIDDLLDLTRITRGKLQLSFETVDAHVLIRDAIKICCSGREQDISVFLDAPRHIIRADSGRMLQIFWNLLNNAAKFTPVGSGIVVQSSNVENNRLRIEVSDSGIGIDPAVLPRIFNAFEQGEAVFRSAIGGLGLGLTIVKALVDAHGGTITARSGGKEQGATFTVELGTLAIAPRQVIKPPPPIESRNGSAGPLQILLVEDHDQTLQLMTRLLSSRGHHVMPAASVKAGLQIAEKEPIDLVISDLGLPDGSGLDLMRELRDRYSLRGICLSGFGMEEDMIRSREAGFFQHLIKPVDLGKLEQAIAASGVSPGSATAH